MRFKLDENFGTRTQRIFKGRGNRSRPGPQGGFLLLPPVGAHNSGATMVVARLLCCVLVIGEGALFRLVRF
jgi:hypothetical protein